MKLCNVKKYKSSILGVVFIVTGIYCLLKGLTADMYVIGGLLISGTLLLFTGDRFIQKLEKVVFGRILFEKKKDEGEEVS